MMRGAIIVTLLVATPLAAQVQSAAPLTVSVEWLRQHLTDRNLVLLHVSSRPGYDTLHIPGAQYIGFQEIGREDGGRVLELPLPAALDSVLEVRGVTENSRIVVYASEEWYTPTTRLYLTLVWAGLGNRTSILDGGMRAWRAATGPVTRDATPAPARGQVTVRPQSDVIVTADWVASRLNRADVAIVDARNERFFMGNYPPPPPNNPTAGDPRPGHIPGAFSLPFTAMIDSTGRFRNAAELRTLFASAGAGPADTVVAYCHIGQQASLVWFGARLAGFNARLYDGSFTEWSRLTQHPVERP